MKKLILLLLFTSFNCFSQSVTRSDFWYRTWITGQIEIDGHFSKEEFVFESNLEGIKIYDKNKKEYIFRKCNKENCLIIHLEPKETRLIIRSDFENILKNNTLYK